MMIASWTGFGVLAVTSEATVTDVWDWVHGLPLIPEIVVWVFAPGTYRLA
jgi:hypothetical protein